MWKEKEKRGERCATPPLSRLFFYILLVASLGKVISIPSSCALGKAFNKICITWDTNNPLPKMFDVHMGDRMLYIQLVFDTCFGACFKCNKHAHFVRECPLMSQNHVNSSTSIENVLEFVNPSQEGDFSFILSKSTFSKTSLTKLWLTKRLWTWMYPLTLNLQILLLCCDLLKNWMTFMIVILRKGVLKLFLEINAFLLIWRVRLCTLFSWWFFLFLQ